MLLPAPLPPTSIHNWGRSRKLVAILGCGDGGGEGSVLPGVLHGYEGSPTTYTAARDQLKALMDRVVEDREVVMVRRRHGGDVALVAADELEGLLETAPLRCGVLKGERHSRHVRGNEERAQTEPAQPPYPNGRVWLSREVGGLA